MKLNRLQLKILKFLQEKGASYSAPVVSEELSLNLNLDLSSIQRQVRSLEDRGLVGIRRDEGERYYLKRDPGNLLQQEG